MREKIKQVGNITVHVVAQKNVSAYISEQDKEMDIRAKAAVKDAINKAKVCKKPVAKYDVKEKKAYVEYSNGEKKYVH